MFLLSASFLALAFTLSVLVAWLSSTWRIGGASLRTISFAFPFVLGLWVEKCLRCVCSLGTFALARVLALALVVRPLALAGLVVAGVVVVVFAPTLGGG